MLPTFTNFNQLNSVNNIIDKYVVFEKLCQL